MKPKVSGPAPCVRHGHSSQLTSDGRILVVGGWTWDESGRPMYLNDIRQLDTETMIWGRCRGGVARLPVCLMMLCGCTLPSCVPLPCR